MREQTATDRFIRQVVIKLIVTGISFGAIFIYIESQKTEVEIDDETEAQATLYRREGLKHSRAKRHSQAIDAFRKYLTLKPKDYHACEHIAKAYSELGQHENAISAWEEYIALKDERPWHDNKSMDVTHSAIGDACVALEKYTDAIAAYTKAISVNPENPEDPDTHWKLARTYKKLGHKSQAVAVYRKITYFKPVSVAAQKVITDARERLSVLSRAQPRT